MLALILFSSLSFAARDSVAVFHRPEKVVVQINERGAVSRLQRIMSAWKVDRELFWETPGRDFYINCGRNERAATCMLRFLPSQAVKISEKEMWFATPYQGPMPPEDHSVAFESSRGHRFELEVQNGEIRAYARKP